MGKKKRLGNLEVMRIIAAVFILLNHIDIQWQLVSASAIADINGLLVRFFHLGGKFGVNIFVLLGAWFIYDKPLRRHQIIRIIVDVFIYGTIMYITASVYVSHAIGFRALIKSYTYWFPFAYVIALLFAPLVHKISQNEKALIIIVSTGAAFFSILTIASEVIRNSSYGFVLKETITGPIWFIYIFFIINFIKQKKIKIPSMRMCLIIWLLLYIAMYVLVVTLNMASVRDMYSPLCFCAALAMFYFFSNVQMENTKIIELLASCSFGTYLVQCNNNFWSIWNNEVFNFSRYVQKNTFCIVVVISVLVYFAITMIIEQLKVLNKIVLSKTLNVNF